MRSFNRQILELLAAPDWQARLAELEAFAPRKLYAPLLAGLLNPDVKLKWRSVSALGLTVSREADAKIEDARVLMRRLMWSLNEESGNIGWGIPESFGEILACHPGLAAEFSRVLCSYIIDRDDEPGNYLELDPLRRAVYWGLMRLAEVKPELVMHARPELILALTSPDAETRGFACRCLGLMGKHSVAQAQSKLQDLLTDQTEIDLYSHRELKSVKISELARLALAG